MELFSLLSLLLLLSTLFAFYISKSFLKRRNQRNCYMLHYECYKGKDERKMDTDKKVKVLERNKNLGLEEYKFLFRTLASSGLGEETYSPKIVHEGKEDSHTLLDAISEMDEIIYDTLDKIFLKTKGLISPSDIDILIVNVSLFAPSPSITSRVINKYKMREDIKSYNLSGLGCSASVISIDIVQRIFQTHENSVALVVNTESLGPQWYCSRDRSMMLSNCLFRAGGSSFLLTNAARFKNRALMKLLTVIRTHVGSDDEAYSCCMQTEDKEGRPGFLLTKYLRKAAARALTKNLTVLLPRVLPIKELIRYAIVRALKRTTTLKGDTASSGIGLNLKTGLQHFCIHPGGRAIIEGVGKSLGLTEDDIEPARMALHRFGNTCAASVWYVLSYMEAKNRLKKGDKILMISMGAGFECNNCVWEVLKDLDGKNVWEDSVDQYPDLSKVPSLFIEKLDSINDGTMSFVRV